VFEPAPTPRPGADQAQAISLTGVTRVFGAQPAIIGVSLAVERGEVVLLRGANGAGKSTLLRVVATALSPTYGRGVVLGFDLAGERDEIRRRTDLLTHRTRLYEELSAAENLRFSCALHGIDPALVPGALERVGLAGAAGERVGGFSQGMRQRVAIARTMLRQAELLLLDEPYAGLDGDARGVVDQVVLAARDAGRTVLLATHQPTRAGLATRTMLLDAGRLQPHPVPPSRSGVLG
jgi:ABC-type multidrug transport system ATPase subunit